MIASRSVAPVPIDEMAARRGLVREDRTIPGTGDQPDLIVSVFRRGTRHRPGLGIYHIHGGGMVAGDRFTSVFRALDLAERFDAAVITIEYRLAPEHPDPAGINDCFAGLVWSAAHADELGFDRDRLMLLGGSAGGGLAAGTALMARDRHGPDIAALVLVAPMLDDRNSTVSSYQVQRFGVWDRHSNEVGWTALLGDRRGTDAVSAYAAPARATDVSRLPPTYIECGSAEVFRDEDVAYAAGIWAAGGTAELHVWPGAHHGFDVIFPEAELSRAAARARAAFVERVIAGRFPRRA